MLSNTGTVSFVLYFIFIAIGVVSLFWVYRLIQKTDIDEGKLDKFLDYFKWVVITLSISTVTMIIGDLFKERDQDVKELEYFDKYVEEVKVVNGQGRLQLSKYFSIVAPSGDMKKSWENYYKEVKKEYEDYLAALARKEKNEANENPTPEIKKQIESDDQKIEMFNAPLAVSTESEWYIVAGGDSTIEAANDELAKAIQINANASIIKKRNSYRTVLMGYLQKADAERELVKVKQMLTSTAYIVNKSSWCSSYEKGEGCLICN